MVNKKITKQKVFSAAKIITQKSVEPTIANVREYLAFTGSQTTLHKYLKEWKLQCFKHYAVYGDVAVDGDLNQLQMENTKLENLVVAASEQNKIMAHELAKTEKKNIELKQQLAEQSEELSLLQAQHNDSAQKIQQLTELYQNIKEERTTILEKIMHDKDRLIESLRQELKQSHEASMLQLKESSYNSHDALLREKVISINLQEQVKELTVQTANSQKSLEQANSALQPLKKELERQRKFIKDVISFEQLQEYEKRIQAKDVLSN